MRIIILGTGPFAVPTCQQLLQDQHDIALVVTRPVADPAAKKQPERPVHQWAQQAGIEIFEPASVNEPEAIEHLSKLQADLLFVCDYGQILSKACLSATRLGGINLHGSLLPRHRGAAPVQWTLLAGDQQAGVTVIHMTPRLDAGPALAIAQCDIGADESAAELEPRLAKLGVAATQRAIEVLQAWDGHSPIGVLQDASLVTKAPRFAKSDGQLDFRRPALDLARQVRACQPWPGTFAELRWPEGKQLRLLIKAARSLDWNIEQLAGQPPGSVVAMDAEQIEELKVPEGPARDWSPPWQRLMAVATEAGTLLIARVQPAGKREMSVEEFLRGHAVGRMVQFVLPSGSA